MMTMLPIFRTNLGQLHQTDCMDLLVSISSETVDVAFADPPFNLGKLYASKINDSKATHDYLDWCHKWLSEMIRVLKPGGSLFLWNLPKWNLPLGAFLGNSLTFRNWITVDIKYSMPISGRLYPAHYSLLYFVKGEKPNIFHPDRTPIVCCRHCGGELRDYGGYKNKLNSQGISLSDVWTDITPVRHAKYKKRHANSLSLKLMDRILSLSSDPGSLVLDPFGGSGTTYVAAELTQRRWVGSELDCTDIFQRFQNLEDDRTHLLQIQSDKNVLFTRSDLKTRQKSGLDLSKEYQIVQNSHTCECSELNIPQEKLFTSV